MEAHGGGFLLPGPLMSLRAAAGAQIFYPESFESTVPRRKRPQFLRGSCPEMTVEEGSLDFPRCARVLCMPQQASRPGRNVTRLTS